MNAAAYAATLTALSFLMSCAVVRGMGARMGAW
jgi:hypothetical protein